MIPERKAYNDGRNAGYEMGFSAGKRVAGVLIAELHAAMDAELQSGQRSRRYQRAMTRALEYLEKSK